MTESRKSSAQTTRHVIYVVRHGARGDWEENPPASLTGLVYDPPLSALGIKQAGELAECVALKWDAAEQPKTLFCSPFYRCIQTIISTIRNIGVQIARRNDEEKNMRNDRLRVTLEDGIAEWYSTLTVKEVHHWLVAEKAGSNNPQGGNAVALAMHNKDGIATRKLPATRDMLQRLFTTQGQSQRLDSGNASEHLQDLPILWEEKSIYPLDPTLGTVEESQADLLQRVQNFLADMVAMGYTQCGPVMLVTHAATAIMIGRALTNNPTRKVNCGVASISKYIYTVDEKISSPHFNPQTQQWTTPWQCVQNGDTSHLSSGEVHNWGFDN